MRKHIAMLTPLTPLRKFFHMCPGAPNKLGESGMMLT